MITRSGIGTLAAGGGVVAAVVCLLVGVQLLLLGGEIGYLLEQAPGSVDPASEAWRNLVRVSGWLSLLAGGLVLLLVTAHRRGWRPPGPETRHAAGPGPDRDVLVRIFEIDDGGRSVEVAAGPAGTPARARRASTPPQPLGSPEDSSRMILEQIDAVSGAPPRPAPRRPSWKAFLRRLVGRKNRS